MSRFPYIIELYGWDEETQQYASKSKLSRFDMRFSKYGLTRYTDQGRGQHLYKEFLLIETEEQEVAVSALLMEEECR